MTMSTAGGKGEAGREALERVLSSACFARSQRVSKLLRFLVEKQLEGRESHLKESVIGVEVFSRRPDYNPKLDSTVRSEAVRLRERLDKYYATEGRQDPLRIELPKGGYVPVFRESEPMGQQFWPTAGDGTHDRGEQEAAPEQRHNLPAQRTPLIGREKVL